MRLSATTAKWIALALLGLAISAGVAVAASNLVSRQIGIASESVSAGDDLAPAVESAARQPSGNGDGDGSGNTSPNPGSDDDDDGAVSGGGGEDSTGGEAGSVNPGLSEDELDDRIDEEEDARDEAEDAAEDRAKELEDLADDNSGKGSDD